MIGAQLVEKAKKMEMPDEVREVVLKLVELFHHYSRINSRNQTTERTLRKSLDLYRQWHSSDEVPPRRDLILVKQRVKMKGRNAYIVRYHRAEYRDGKFLLKGREIEISGWALMPYKATNVEYTNAGGEDGV